MERYQITKRPRYGLWIMLLLILLLLGGAIFTAVYFKTDRVEISGVETYTQDEVMNSLKKNRYVNNTLVMVVKTKVIGQKSLPFVEEITMSFKNPKVLLVHVKEKERAGVIEQNNRYLYFNFIGEILEEQKVLYEGVPVVAPMDMGTLKVGTKIPFSEDRLHALLSLTREVANYDLHVTDISIDDADNISMKLDNFTILVGSEDYLNAKIAKLKQVMKTVKTEYDSGIINLTRYTDDKEIITISE